MYTAVVQLKWSPEMFRNENTYIQKLDSILKEISNRVPKGRDTLVVFPEDLGTFLCLLGSPDYFFNTDLLDGIRRLILKNIIGILWLRLRYRVGWVRALAIHKSPKAEQVHIDTFSRLAQKYGYWIVAGTLCLHENNGKVYNTALVFGPDGNLQSRQRKVHLIDIEGSKGLDLSEAELGQLTVFSIGRYKCGIAICLDCFKDDVVDALSSNKLDLLIQPSANPGLWDREQQSDWLNGCRHAVVVKKAAKWGLNPMLVGSVMGLDFQGQSSIISADVEYLGGYSDVEPVTGFLKVASSPTSEEVLIAELG